MSNMREAAQPGYYRARVAEGEAAMREHSQEGLDVGRKAWPRRSYPLSALPSWQREAIAAEALAAEAARLAQEKQA